MFGSLLKKCSICGEIDECMPVRIVNMDDETIKTKFVCKDECYERLKGEIFPC